MEMVSTAGAKSAAAVAYCIARLFPIPNCGVANAGNNGGVVRYTHGLRMEFRHENELRLCGPKISVQSRDKIAQGRSSRQSSIQLADFPRFHSLVDEVNSVPMNTNQRLKDALQRIANGDDDPVGIAKEALRSRRIVAKPKVINSNYRTLDEMRRQSDEKADDIFNQWVAAGKPTLREFAILIGKSKSWTSWWLNGGKRRDYYRTLKATRPEWRDCEL